MLKKLKGHYPLIAGTILLLCVLFPACGGGLFVDYARAWTFSLIENLNKKDHISYIDHDVYIPRRSAFNAIRQDCFYSAGILVCSSKDKNPKNAAEKLIGYTDYYKIKYFKKALIAANTGNAFYNRNKSENPLFIIPGASKPQTTDTTNHHRPVIPEIRGLYLTGNTTGSESIFKKIHYFKKYGINAVVFDAKDVTGIVNYKSSVPLVEKYNLHSKAPIENLPLLIRFLKKNRIYVIARIAVFRDFMLSAKAPTLSLRSKSTGALWSPGGNELWCDPSNAIVQNYNIGLALELASMGIDEIQFDYIRFPTAGNQNDILNAPTTSDRKKIIKNFLEKASSMIHAARSNVSIDIFGVVAWGKKIDINRTGQDISLLSKHCDVISPMLYPSHFNDDFDGFPNPADHPYEFIFKGCEKVRALTGKDVLIRPWLQAFPWKVSSYNHKYILKQIKASKDSGSEGYLFWNAGNNYSTVLSAMQHIIPGKNLSKR